jgi:UBX domain-containing protein 7
MLAEMYRPPFEIMSRVDFEEGRQEGREQEKWLLVNIQDPAVFDCQLLNRDLWKNPQVRDTVKENFVFLQYNKEDTKAAQYLQYYFQAYDTQDSYPHISIVDPRTGEQVKAWTGPPVPNPAEFVMQLHEFLDRYSLKHNARNPVAKRKPEVKKEKKLDMMSEEEMLEMAVQNSLASEATNRQEDPDDLTRSIGDLGKGKGKVIDLDDEDMQDAPPLNTNGHVESAPTPVVSPFSSISSEQPHHEPPADPTVTRIQFRHSGGRVIRRFALADPVRRIYEWLKASPLEGKEGVEFELVFMSKNLMDSLEHSIEEAGLKNGTVMVEFLEED